MGPISAGMLLSWSLATAFVAAAAYAAGRRRAAPERPGLDGNGNSREQKMELLARLVSSAEYAVVSATAEGIMTSWNPSAERVFGYKAEEVLGKDASMFFPPEDRSQLAGLLDRALREGHVVAQLRNVRKDGSVIWVSDDVSPLRDARGALLGFSAVVRDVTDIKSAEEELRRMLAGAAAADRGRGASAGGPPAV